MNKTPSPEELKELIGIADLYLPVIRDAIDKFAPVLGEQFKRVDRFFQETQVASFDFYLDAGFSRQEALLLVINAKVSLQEILQRQSGSGR